MSAASRRPSLPTSFPLHSIAFRLAAHALTRAAYERRMLRSNIKMGASPHILDRIRIWHSSALAQARGYRRPDRLPG